MTVLALSCIHIDGWRYCRTATAWAIVKAILPLRLIVSVWGTPWFARTCVLPCTRWFKSFFPKSKSGAKAATQTNVQSMASSKATKTGADGGQAAVAHNVGGTAGAVGVGTTASGIASSPTVLTTPAKPRMKPNQHVNTSPSDDNY